MRTAPEKYVKHNYPHFKKQEQTLLRDLKVLKQWHDKATDSGTK